MDRITEEAIASLQAQVAIQHLVLLSLVRSHPDPPAVLAQWRSLLADAGERRSGLPSTGRRSELVGECCERFAEVWTAQLVDESVNRASLRRD